MNLEKNNKIEMKFLVGICLIIILLLGFCFLTFYKEKADNDKLSNDGIYDNYIYKIRYDLETETYIYLFPEDILKIVEVQEIYAIDPSCNCMQSTGEIDYNEQTVNFSAENQKKVIEILDELHKKHGKRELNVDNMHLSKYQQKVLLATILNLEDVITLENNLKYKTVHEEFNSKINNFKIINSKVILDNLTENKTVNRIANYLNEIVNKEFDQLNIESKEIIENIDIAENLGVDLELELVYSGPYGLSFIYTQEGQLGAVAIYDVKGFTFNYSGDIYSIDDIGLKDKYYKDLLNNFMQDDLYINYKDQLVEDWKSILYDNMFFTGNWYLIDDKIEFIIPAYLLGFDEATAKNIDVQVNK